MNIFNFFKKETPQTNNNINLFLSVIAKMLVNKYKQYEPILRHDNYIHATSIEMSEEDSVKYKEMLFDAFGDGSSNNDRKKFYDFEKKLIHKYYPKSLHFSVLEGMLFDKLINNLSEYEYKTFISYIKTNKISDHYKFEKFEKNEFGIYNVYYTLI